MDWYHVIGITEAQLHQLNDGSDEAARLLGLTVLKRCLGESVRLGNECTEKVFVDHLDTMEFTTAQPSFRMWMWEVGDSVCMADMPKEDVDLAIKLACAVEADQVRRLGRRIDE